MRAAERCGLEFVDDPGTLAEFFAEIGGVVAALSAREGGVSGAPYDSANMGLHVGDDPAAVLENRRRFCSELGINPNDLVCAQQVHGNRIATATETDRGRGAKNTDTALPATDGLMSDVPGVPLAMFTADCVPVFLYEPNKRVVGIAHAGWRGTVSRIAETLVRSLEEQFGADASLCRAALGPSAGPCCYEVGENVVTAFRENGHPVERIFVPGGHGKPHLSLWEANTLQLERCGVPRENVSWTKWCSVCSDAYFSCRRDGGVTGRSMSVIIMR
jgi:YfiH family protein